MSTYAQCKAELFKLYGEDADGAVAAMPNAFPDMWRWFVDHAIKATYLREFKAWRRSQIVEAAIEKPEPAALFPTATPRPAKISRFRARITARDGDHEVLPLGGIEGARALRDAAERDSKGAKTTLVRCTTMLRFADELEAAAARGEHLTVAEIIRRAA